MSAAPTNPPGDEDGEMQGQKSGVIAVDRALSILDALIATPGAASLSELARATGLVKPTVLRSLASLERAGYILRVQDRRYQLGAKAAQLGASYKRNFKLDAIVLPALRRLTADTRESSSFLIREADKRVLLFRVESPQTVREVVETNVAHFLDATSGSEALTHVPPANGAEDRPIYFTSGVNDPQSASISTPIYGFNRQLAGAVSLSAPINRLDEAHAATFARSLCHVADDLTLALGGHPFAKPGFRLLGIGGRRLANNAPSSRRRHPAK